MVRKAQDEPRIQNWRSGVAGASKWSVTILAGTASIWRPYMPITTQKILMKSSGSTTAMVMERSVGDVCLRGSSKRDARRSLAMDDEVLEARNPQIVRSETNKARAKRAGDVRSETTHCRCAGA